MRRAILVVLASLLAPGVVWATTPSVRSSSTHQQNGQPITPTLPATINNGDLIIIFGAIDGNDPPPITWDNTSCGTWTNYMEQADASHTTYIYAKVADGTEDSCSLSVTHSGGTEKNGWIMLAIQDWEGTLGGGFDNSPGATDTSTNPDPDAADDGWGTVDRMSIAWQTHNDETTTSAYPSGYNDNQTARLCETGGSGSCEVSLATKAGTEGSQNPGTFTIGGNDNWRAHTISVKGTGGAPAATPKMTLVGVGP